MANWILLVATCCLLTSHVSSQQAKEVLKLISQQLYKAKANSGFVAAIELDQFSLPQLKGLMGRFGIIAKMSCSTMTKRSFNILDIPVDIKPPVKHADASHKEVLDLLYSSEGQHIIEEVAGDKLTEEDKSISRRAVASVKTYMYYIPSGNLRGKTKAGVLLTRVRNATANKYVVQAYNLGLEDATARNALQKLALCSSQQRFSSVVAG